MSAFLPLATNSSFNRASAFGLRAGLRQNGSQAVSPVFPDFSLRSPSPKGEGWVPGSFSVAPLRGSQYPSPAGFGPRTLLSRSIEREQISKDESIARYYLSGLYGNSLREHWSGIDAGVKFSDLAAGIDARRQLGQ